jgi:GrpB-like predicted nucleotidyltransferase (UPF0157 family)
LPGVIVVVEYDPAWPQRFEQLRREYTEAVAAAGVPVVAIEHVGSTSVPGLAAKPVIDCDIVVAGQAVAAASQALTGLGHALGRTRDPAAVAAQGTGAAGRDQHLRRRRKVCRCATTSLSGTSCGPIRACASSTPP